MGFFSRKDKQDTHEEWNNVLEGKGLNDGDRAKECNKNYISNIGKDELAEKQLNKDLRLYKSNIEQFSDNQQDNNTNLQKEQITKVNNNNYENKEEVKEDLEEVRENKSIWKLW